MVDYLLRTGGQNYSITENYVISKGIPVLIPVYAIHHDPEIYPDPEIFNPDRFTSKNIEKRHEFAYLPFGKGPRSCFGENFALMQMQIGISKILSTFHIGLASSEEMCLTFNKIMDN